MSWVRTVSIWSVVVIVCVAPIIVAMNSPLLEWRNVIYITASFGGVIALALMVLQPLLAVGFLPGVSLLRGRRVHRWVGVMLVLSLVVHVVGLWITSPPDVIDALLFVSATPFSLWGVIAMWGVFISATLVLFRRKLTLAARNWLLLHRCLALVIVVGSVVHAMMIEGTMGLVSKVLLCAVVVAGTGFALVKKWRRGRRSI